MESVQSNMQAMHLAPGYRRPSARSRMKRFSLSISGTVKTAKLAAKRGLCMCNSKKFSGDYMDNMKVLSHQFVCRRRHIPSAVGSQPCSDLEMDPCSMEEKLVDENGHLESFKKSLVESKTSIGEQSRHGDFRTELLFLGLPAIVGQAIDPLAQLAETVCIGRLGAIELASAGISITVFNIVSKIFNIPLMSITTSFVAEDISKNLIRQGVSDGYSQANSKNTTFEKYQLPSVSSALLLAVGIGSFEALALFWGSRQFLTIMGISQASPMHIPAQKFLSLRALGAPAVVLSLAIQGIFRGFKDTRTPLFCVGIGNLSAVVLLPLLVFALRLGLFGAAIATVLSQYIATALLIWCLSKRAILLPPRMKDLEFDGYIKSGGLLMGRTLSVLTTMTLGTSMAARQGPVAMAAHQICMQIWLSVSLLSDALASSSQALIASSFTRYDYQRVKNITYFVLKIALLTGIALALVLGMSFNRLAELFTKDTEVLQIVRSAVLFVSASQPINALAFVIDGLHYGVSDFSYAASSMMAVGVTSSALLLYAPSKIGLPGVWLGLTLFMCLRAVAGAARLLWRTGPWRFLWQDPRIFEAAN